MVPRETAQDRHSDVLQELMAAGFSNVNAEMQHMTTSIKELDEDLKSINVRLFQGNGTVALMERISLMDIRLASLEAWRLETKEESKERRRERRALQLQVMLAAVPGILGFLVWVWPFLTQIGNK